MPSSTTSFASGGTAPGKRATTSSELPLLDLGVAGRDLDVGRPGRRGVGSRRRGRPRSEPGSRARSRPRPGRRGPPGGRAWPHGSPSGGRRSSQSCERLCSRALATTVSCRKPSRPEGACSVLLDGGQEAGVQVGMRRLDPAGDAAEVSRRPHGDRRRRRGPRPAPGPRTQRRPPIGPHPGRGEQARRPGPRPTSRGPGCSRGEPRGPGARPVPTPAVSSRLMIRRASARFGRGRPSRPASQVSTIRTVIAARISGRQSFWRPSSSAFCICRITSRSASMRDALIARRQPNCSSVSTSRGAVLLSAGSRFTANSRAPWRSRPRRRRAASVSVNVEAPRREPRRRAVRLADGDGPFGQRHALLDEPVGARGPVRRPRRRAGPTSAA